MIDRVRLRLLVALIVFLPLSAWLVSFTGSYLVSLGRDLLLGLFLILTLTDFKNFKKPNLVFWLGAVFIGLVLASYFVRQDSLTQWLRGVRYLIEPVLLLLALVIKPLPSGWQKPIGQALLASLVLVLVGSLVDFFWPFGLRFSLDPTQVGYLGQVHLAGDLIRLQSTLAGPNALGLYLLVIALLTPVWRLNLPRWLAISLIIATTLTLVMTFSRSSLLGLYAGLIFYAGLVQRKLTQSRRYLALLMVGVVIIAAWLIVFKPTALTRFSSNNIRWQQYERIWQEKSDIGLLGRGAGTAGLVSEFSFDHSNNYFSENSYLDVYENTGLLGGLAYLALWVSLIVALVRQPRRSPSVCAAVLGLAIAGLFIDHFTGQAAIWLTMIMAGLVLSLDNSAVNRDTASAS